MKNTPNTIPATWKWSDIVAMYHNAPAGSRDKSVIYLPGTVQGLPRSKAMQVFKIKPRSRKLVRRAGGDK